MAILIHNTYPWSFHACHCSTPPLSTSWPLILLKAVYRLEMLLDRDTNKFFDKDITEYLDKYQNKHINKYNDRLIDKLGNMRINLDKKNPSAWTSTSFNRCPGRCFSSTTPTQSTRCPPTASTQLPRQPHIAVTRSHAALTPLPLDSQSCESAQPKPSPPTPTEGWHAELQMNWLLATSPKNVNWLHEHYQEVKA